MTDGQLAAARDVAEGLKRRPGSEVHGEIVSALLDEVALLRASLAASQAVVVAVCGALPSWCGEGALAERVATVVRVAEALR